jgi:hypothetical protein
MPCPDCEQLYAELEALKAELKAERATLMQRQERILDQLDQVIAGFDRKHQTLLAYVDRCMHDSLARLEAAMRLPRGEPPSEPPARH